ncbi:MAG: hypothetical protein IPP53_14050 [Bacteroidetes bacterium]|nr:hypothetical protein [Bacteroidota bacterium]
MGEDCIWLSYTGISEGLDQICIETCDNRLNLCDTTVIILSEKIERNNSSMRYLYRILLFRYHVFISQIAHGLSVMVVRS